VSETPAPPIPVDRPLPVEVSRALEDFVQAARVALGDNLDAVVLFGSAADGTLTPTSDVNVIVVLSAFDRAQVDRLRTPFRVAQASIRMAAMVLLRDEIAAAAAAFAQKFADITRRRRVLHGRDPFAGLTVPRAALVIRLDQVLLNLTLRLRAAYVERSLREEQLVPVLAEAVGPLSTSAASLVELEGRSRVAPAEALGLIGREVAGAVWEALTATLAQARRRERLEAGVGGTTLLQLVELAMAMRHRLAAL